MELTTLKDLVSIPSIYPNEGNIGDYLFQSLSNAGFVVEKQSVEKNRFNVLGEKGEGEKTLLLFGHMDTVLLRDGWKTDPYTLTEKEDKLFGLGAWDMKAGLASILEAVKTEVKGYKLKVAFVVDEENLSIGMDTLIKSGWIKDVDAAIATEPGFNYGLRGIAVGRVGRSVYDVVITTKGGHVYKYADSVNAITEASKLVSELSSISLPKHEKLGQSVIFVRSIHGEANSMSIPEKAVVQIEARTVEPQTVESVKKDLERIVDKANLQGDVIVKTANRPTPFCDSFTINESNKFLQFCTSNLSSVVGGTPTYYYRRSVADENRVAKEGIPVLTIGPDGGGAHEANEWVSKSSMEDLTIFLKKIIVEYTND